MKLVKSALLVVGSFVLTMMITGFIYEQVSRMKAKKYEIGETFTDVGGYKLHYKVMGRGEPTVVFESGLDLGGLSAWYKVQPEVAKFARTISYDRAGIFMSERGDKPKTGENMATDLYTLLKKTGHHGPYILVGHSMAGVTLRSFVDKYANEVAGVVLIDAAHPVQFKRKAVGPVLKTLLQQSPPPANWIAHLIADSGFTRFVYRDAYEGAYPSTMPTDFINVIPKAFKSVALPAVCEEISAFELICDQAEHLKNFANIPLIIITAADEKKRAMGFHDAKTYREFMKTWMELQHDHLKLSSNSKQIFAQNSGHFVQLDEPQIVTDAVHRLIGKP